METKDKANVLVIGNSGVGKSTLINSIFGEDRALTGLGEAVTDKLAVYDNPGLPFRLIDTIGFEFGFFKQKEAIHAVQKWSKESIKKDEPQKQIDLIWYCVDATSRKMFSKNIEMLTKAVKTWEHAPVIVVLTKSYSIKESEENIQMVRDSFSRYKKSINLKEVIPVVASDFHIDDDTIVPSRGIPELIDKTNELIPEAIRLSAEAVEKFKINQKRKGAQTLVGGCVVTAGVLAAVPIPMADAALLSPLEVAMIKGIGKIYGISEKKNDDAATKLIKTMVEVGTVSTVAKGIVSVVAKLNIATAIINVAVACTIVAGLGETAIVVMEKISSGEINIDDLDWIKKFTESELAKKAGGKINIVIEEIIKKEKIDIKDIPSIILKIFFQ